MNNIELQLEQLESAGYTIFPQFLDRLTAGRIRQHMDTLLPPVAATEADVATRLHILRHPIPGAIMAEILANPRLLELAAQLLCISKSRAHELRLLEQVLIRTDPELTPRGATGWHIDMPFFPHHYHATPRQTYFHMVHALSTVVPGGGAFMAVPGSHHQTYAAAAQMSTHEELEQLHKNPVAVAAINVDQAVEVCPNEGDLLVFNPMCVHSASGNGSTQSRYVYFASFFDTSATDLHQRLRDMHYRDGFPASLRDNLPQHLHSLLDP